MVSRFETPKGVQAMTNRTMTIRCTDYADINLKLREANLMALEIMSKMDGETAAEFRSIAWTHTKGA
jgi:hypothetical protein